MQELVIRVEGLNAPHELYAAFLQVVGAPHWHGRNLDALWDSITKGDINRINPPFRVRIVGCAKASEAVRQLIERFTQLIQEASDSGVPVEIVAEA